MRKLIITLALMVVLTLGLLPATMVSAAAGLVALWHFDEGSGASTVADSSGHGNTGTVLGATTGVLGKFGNALYFDGVCDWVDIPNLSINGDFSIEFWVNLDPGIGNADCVVGQEGLGQDINFYQGKCRWYNPGQTPYDSIIANTVAQPQTWEHYAITRSGDTLTLYRNGTQDATAVRSGISAVPFQPMAIGRGTAGYFGGKIDEVGIWNSALSAAQIALDYGGNEFIVNASTHPPASPTMPANLEPASMSVQYLGITPRQVSASQPVTITTNVVNNGDQAGSLNVALKINDKVEQSKLFSVGPRGTYPVKFTVTKAQPGTYTVDIGGQRDSFTVLGTSSSTEAGSSSLIVIIVIAALVLATVIILSVVFRRTA